MSSRKHDRAESGNTDSNKASRKHKCCVSMQWAGPTFSTSYTARDLNSTVPLESVRGKPLKIMTCFEMVSPVINLAKYYDHIEETVVSTSPFLGVAMTSERKPAHTFLHFPVSEPAHGCLWHSACETGKVDLLLADHTVSKGSRVNEFKTYLRVGKPSRVIVFTSDGKHNAIVKASLTEAGYPEPHVSSYNACDLGLPRVQDLYVISSRYGVSLDAFGMDMQEIVDGMGRKAVAIESLCASVSDELVRGWAQMPKRTESSKDVDEYNNHMEYLRNCKLLPNDAVIPGSVVVTGALSGRGRAQVGLLTHHMRKVSARVGFSSFGNKDSVEMCYVDGSMPNVPPGGKTAVLAVADGETYRVTLLTSPHLLALQGYDPLLYNCAVCPTSAVSDALSRATPFQLVLAAFAAALRVDQA